MHFNTSMIFGILLILSAFTLLLGYNKINVPKEMFNEYACIKPKIASIIMPPEFDPYENMNTAMKRTSIYDMNNKEFQNIFKKNENKNLFNSEKKWNWINVTSKEIREQQTVSLVGYIYKLYPVLSEKGFIFKHANISIMITNYEEIYMKIDITLHSPGAAYGKVIQVEAVKHIKNNTYTSIKIHFLGNIIESNIPLLDSFVNLKDVNTITWQTSSL